MKNLVVLLFGVVAFGFSACTKCNVCEVRDTDNSLIYTYPEECGKKKDMEVYASKCEAEYGQYDYKCICNSAK